ncbi:MAG TPA: exosortase A [Burkholderiaceae bacterium]
MTAVKSRLEIASMRQALPALLLVLGVMLFAYRDTAAAMVAIWARSQTFAHAFLVPPIVSWLIWRKRAELAALRPRPCAWMLLPMIGVAFVWLLGDLGSVNSATQFAMTALLVLAVPAVLGLQVANVILFPLVFLFFAVPFGDFLLPQLMTWTADFTVHALRASGIPVFREGMHFVIPNGNWSVVEACSGVRYLIASFMVGTLFAYLNYRSVRRRWIFAAVALGVPIVANWVRAYLIVLLGYLSGNEIAVGVDHLIYGWLFFGLVIGIMFAIGAIWAEPDAAPAGPATSRAAMASAPPRRVVSAWAVAVAAAVIAIVPHAALQSIGGIRSGAPPQLARVSPLSGGWQASSDPMPSWKPAFQNPTADLTSTYSLQGRDVGVYIGYYRAQDYRRKLVSSDNELVQSKDPVWAQVAPAGSHRLKVLGQALTVRTAPLRGVVRFGMPEQRLEVWQLYWVGGRLTASDVWAKIYGVVGRLLGHGDDSAVIVLYTRQEQSGGAPALLESFAQANLGAIVAQLRNARDVLQADAAADRRIRYGVRL